MIQLALLLLGLNAIQHHWRTLGIVGLVWIALGLVVIIDPLDGVQNITMHTLGALLVIEGVVALAAGVISGQGRSLTYARAGALIVAGLAVIDTPFRNVVLISVLFGTALAVDGLVRMMASLLVRFSGWRVSVGASGLELILAVLALTPWPVSYERTVPFCLGVALVLSGWTIGRSALLLRRLPSDAPITTLPIFEQGRGWHVPPMLPSPQPGWVDEETGPRLIVRVWTAVASATDPVRRPLLDRYIAAVDRAGTVSTGHAALEMPPDLYISHYGAQDADRTGGEFRRALDASTRNDVTGRFLPSYAHEVGTWCEANESVTFRRFDPERLRAFWEHYRADPTYNLTNRNCSVVVALALDVALEGVLGQERAWSPLMRLVLHPDLHLATMLRKRASAMTWTPGLVLDYARALQRVVEPPPLRWTALLALALGRRRQARMAWRSGAGEVDAAP